MEKQPTTQRVIECLGTLQTLNRSLTATSNQRKRANKPVDRIDTELALCAAVEMTLETVLEDLTEPPKP